MLSLLGKICLIKTALWNVKLLTFFFFFTLEKLHLYFFFRITKIYTLRRCNVRTSNNFGQVLNHMKHFKRSSKTLGLKRCDCNTFLRVVVAVCPFLFIDCKICTHTCVINSRTIYSVWLCHMTFWKVIKSELFLNIVWMILKTIWNNTWKCYGKPCGTNILKYFFCNWLHHVILKSFNFLNWIHFKILWNNMNTKSTFLITF